MSEQKSNLCDGCALWPCGSHAPIGVDGCIVTECANRKPTSGELIATLKAQRDELLAVLADIGSYTGEGRLNSAWQSIVKSLGEKARAAIANVEKDEPGC